MLLLLSAASGLPRVLLPESAGSVCLSTATHRKTSECNIDCNARRHRKCPHECMCAPANTSKMDLRFGLPADSFKRLVRSAQEQADEASPRRPITEFLTDHRFTADEAAPILPMPAATADFLSRRHDSTEGSPTATLPNNMVGSYLKTWACKDRSQAACKGPDEQNINVIFSGYSALAKALPAALNEEKGAVCTDADQKWCDAQVEFMVTTTHVAKSKKEAIKMALEPGNFLEPKCKPCYAAEEPKNDARTRLQLGQGVPFLSVGGANRNGLINAQRLEDYSKPEGLDEIKKAGFQGVCFDVESTEGEDDLVDALERAFAACKKAGLLVMVTTSHTAPYAAASDASKPLMVDSWVRSTDIDIFSPQLYTSGRESSPEYDETPCAEGCSYERLKQMKAMWVPSIAKPSHYEALREFFANMGITTHGYLQWNDEQRKGGGSLFSYLQTF